MRTIITFTAASLLMASAFGAGEIYRWKGADGAWVYSDQPRPGAELVRTTGSRAQPASEAAPQNTTPAAPAAAPMASDSSPLPVSDAVAEEVRAAADAAKGEQCKQYEAAYQEAIKARSIYKTDEQGKRVYLTSAEIDRARLEARAARDLACGPN
ncbi:MAG TPA: DUF4124 domain-containing protein [Steroidobacteraceae bacterium]|nr:DUF4124 domain-containing protein [Steroidobacteraceae bacterium]